MQRSILITGCSSGIGHASAHALHARGWRVFASCRKPADVARLRDEGLACVRLDLDDTESIRAAVAEVLAANGGRLDALFNNGGWGQVGAVEDLARDALRAQFETLVFGWADVTNRVVPVMRAQGHGRIVMNSSVLGYAAMAYRGAYNAAKFAIEGLGDTLRRELHDAGIHVSLIEPGPIASRFRDNALAHFLAHIDWEKSVHRASYQAQMARLEKPGPAAPFTLGPEAVVAKLIHALESKRPRARYPVTVPAHAFYWGRRLLSERAMDWVLARASGGGKR
jgi:NAD(P)-dependent dehydrogenase (short-subunit alcohol dehydrogenase family)